LSIARGSLKELETHLLLSAEVGLLAPSDLGTLLEVADQVSRMLSGLRNALKNKE